MSISQDSHPSKCILLDLDGTLYESPEYSERLEVELVKYVSETLGLTEDQAKVILQQRRGQFGTLTRAVESLEIDRERLFQAIADRLDPCLFLSKDLTLQHLIGELRGVGFKVALVSNSGRPLVKKILAAIGLELQMFDVVVTSSEAEPKPSPQPFLLAMKEVGCDISHTMYVGDRDEAELRPAKELGIRTVLIDRTGAARSRWADFTIRDISEVAEVAMRTA
jgi:putative hydrolase of the HAD superfamily